MLLRVFSWLNLLYFDFPNSLLGFQKVTNDASGNANFTFNFTPDAAKTFITATATNIATGDTSEFSACRVTTLPDGDGDGKADVAMFRLSNET